VRRATICFVFLAFTVQAVTAQGVPPLSGPQAPPASGVPQAPVGHRQPKPADLPPAVQKEEQPGALGNPQPQAQSQPPTEPQTQSPIANRAGSGRRAARFAGRAELRGRWPRSSCAGPKQGVVSCRRDRGAEHTQAELVQVRRQRQNSVHRDGVHGRPSELRRAIVLSRDQ
jgi:hypothetical protein